MIDENPDAMNLGNELSHFELCREVFPRLRERSLLGDTLSKGLDLQALGQQLKDAASEIKQFGDSPTVLLVGEHHYFGTLLKHQEIEASLIESVEPEMVLHELCTSGVVIDPTNEQIWLQPNRRRDDGDLISIEAGDVFSHQTRIISAVKKVGAIIVGPDLTFGESSQLIDELGNEFDGDWHSRLISGKREDRMIKVIQLCHELTARPLLVFLGAAHVEAINNASLLRSGEQQLDYLSVILKDRESLS